MTPPLVLVHGHPFDHTMWAPQIARFGGDRRVIARDLRGYGSAPVTPGVVTLDVFARDIAEHLDELGVSTAVLAGLSMGGQIVMEFHRLFPERVAGLLLADTTAEPETEDGRRARRAMADEIERAGIGFYADDVLTKMVSPRNVETMPEVAAHVSAMMHATPPQGAAAALRGRAERPDYRPSLRAVTVPTAVVVGSEDEFTPVASARAIHESVPGSTLTVVEGAAHMPNLERPQAFDTALAALLTAVDYRAAASRVP